MSSPPGRVWCFVLPLCGKVSEFIQQSVCLREDKGRVKVWKALSLAFLWLQQRGREREGGFWGKPKYKSVCLSLWRPPGVPACVARLPSQLFHPPLSPLSLITTPLQLCDIFAGLRRRDVLWEEVTPELNTFTLENLGVRLRTSRRLYEWGAFGETFTHRVEWRAARCFKRDLFIFATSKPSFQSYSSMATDRFKAILIDQAS